MQLAPAANGRADAPLRAIIDIGERAVCRRDGLPDRGKPRSSSVRHLPAVLPMPLQRARIARVTRSGLGPMTGAPAADRRADAPVRARGAPTLHPWRFRTTRSALPCG